MLERGAVVGREVREGAERMANLDVAKLQLFDGALSKVSDFITGCKLYIRNKLAGATVQEQVHVMERFGPNIFIFLLSIFLLILYLFFFSFSFRTMKKAHDNEVT